MTLLVMIYSIFTVFIGFCALMFLILTYISGKNIDYISYTPHSESDVEYTLRALLFMYPNATIDTVENEISKRMKLHSSRIITHQEI